MDKKFPKATEIVDGCKLPPHLAKVARKVERQNKEWGFTDFSKVDRSKFDDFHPIHAMLGEEE